MGVRICDNCLSEHEGTYGGGRFCTSHCARGFSTKEKRQEINLRVSKKLVGRHQPSKILVKREPRVKHIVKCTDRIKLGIAAEHIFIAKCLLNGLSCYTPVTNDGKIDLIVGANRIRCQVKTLVSNKHGRYISTRKVGCNSRTNTKVSWYSSDDIDFMIEVDVEEFIVYIIPIDITAQYRSTISICSFAEYKEAFERIEGHKIMVVAGTPNP